MYDDMGQIMPAWRSLCKEANGRGTCKDARGYHFYHVDDKRKNGERIKPVSEAFLGQWARKFRITEQPYGRSDNGGRASPFTPVTKRKRPKSPPPQIEDKVNRSDDNIENYFKTLIRYLVI